nr:DNA-binding pseudobarrel domain-containing protein [Tanacetum cinerariifolium]
RQRQKLDVWSSLDFYTKFYNSLDRAPNRCSSIDKTRGVVIVHSRKRLGRLYHSLTEFYGLREDSFVFLYFMKAELRDHENEDLGPTIEEGEIVDEPMVDVVKIRDKDTGDIIFGKPFYKDLCVEAGRFNGFITIHNGNDNVSCQMARSHSRFKHLSNEQCNKVQSLLKSCNRRISSGTSDDIAAVTTKLDSLGRGMKKLKDNVKGVEEVKFDVFRRPFPNNGGSKAIYHVGLPGYYTRMDKLPPFSEKKPSLEETINKHIEESTKRRAETEEWTRKI